MSVKAAELEETSAADDFQALEDKIFRAIEMVKHAREAQVSAERHVRRVQDEMKDQQDELQHLRRENVTLRKEREEVRARVEKMLKQIDALTAADSGR
jgi:translation initiation factor 2B subunit (eIF-2B alpha/beta/delta family)